MKKGQKVKLNCTEENIIIDAEYVCEHRNKQIFYTEHFCWPYYDHDPKNPDGVVVTIEEQNENNPS